MKHFAIALIAATAVADHWLDFHIKYNGSSKPTYLHSKKWSEADTNGRYLNIYGNNSLFLRLS